MSKNLFHQYLWETLLMPFSQSNTANTISVNYQPGEDFRDFPTQNRSIFTFGDYRITKSGLNDFVSGDTSNLMFDGYESLSSLNVSGFSQDNSVFVSSKELNFEKNNPKSYAYFQTLKMDIAKSIDNIINEWPYGIAALSINSGVTGYEYTAVTTGDSAVYSTIKIPFSAITNQGGLVLNSGSTITGRSLMKQTQDFVVQLSGSSMQEHPQHVITNYVFSAGTYLEFTFDSVLLTGQTSGETILPIWIRPTDKIIKDFYAKRTNLEKHLLTSGEWRIKDPQYDNEKYITQTYAWPKSIDGFNFDTYGQDYLNYEESVLNLAELVDCDTTNIMMRTMVPENLLDMDTSNELYRKTIQTYANEFDKIKRYIDGISFAHTVEYSGENSVPNKFLIKLAELLGWKLTSGFSEIDLFEYLTSEVGESHKSKKEFDIELWRRIMVNLIWLFKRKGTRDALQFIFKLIGAPECLIRLEEFVYDINTAVLSTPSLLENEINNKVNENGYIQYNSSQFVFQEGGKGRGNGQKYIQQWTPEFDPILRIDNIKTYTGDTVFFGTENVVNTKELIAGLDPAQAIECDMHQYYQLSGTCWQWGSGSAEEAANSGTSEDYAINCSTTNPESISGMSLHQWVEYIYKSNINPTNRKITDAHNGGYHYHQLRSIYMHYYKMTTPDSNSMSFGKLEKFLELIEVQFYCSAEQLIPATSILKAFGTIYRNTVFNRQKYPYPSGINDGSEFQTIISNPKECLKPVQISNSINDMIQATNNMVHIESQVVASIDLNVSPFVLEIGANVNMVNNQINGFDIEIEVDDFTGQEQIVEG